MTDFEVASALNIIAESHNSRAIMIDIANRVITFEGPEEQEKLLAIAVSEFMNTIKYIDPELFRKFKVACAEKLIDMRQAILDFMAKFADTK